MIDYRIVRLFLKKAYPWAIDYEKIKVILVSPDTRKIVIPVRDSRLRDPFRTIDVRLDECAIVYRKSSGALHVGKLRLNYIHDPMFTVYVVDGSYKSYTL